MVLPNAKPAVPIRLPSIPKPKTKVINVSKKPLGETKKNKTIKIGMIKAILNPFLKGIISYFKGKIWITHKLVLVLV